MHIIIARHEYTYDHGRPIHARIDACRVYIYARIDACIRIHARIGACMRIRARVFMGARARAHT